MTRIIAYPIPRFDSAVFIEFGNGRFLRLFDAPSGYHQLAVHIASQEKLAFQGPDAIKWTYTVMPFGPTNGPATFISMIYDLDSQWKALATSVGITVGDNTDMRIIVDDIVSHGPTIDISLLYMECQLRICKAYRLSLSLKKSFIFPERFEFVGKSASPDKASASRVMAPSGNCSVIGHGNKIRYRYEFILIYEFICGASS